MAKLADFRDFCRIFRRTLFVSVLCILCTMSFAFGDNLTVYYYCNSTSNPPSYQDSVPEDSITITSSNPCNFDSGVNYFWICHDDHGVSQAVQERNVAVNPGGTYVPESSGYDVVCRAAVSNWCSGGTHTNMIEYISGDNSIDYSVFATSYNPSYTNPDVYNVSFSYGTVGVQGICSGYGDAIGLPMSSSSLSEGDKYCWCKMVSYTPSGGNQTTYFTGDLPAVFNARMYSSYNSSGQPSDGFCDAEQCAAACAGILADPSSQPSETVIDNLYTACTYGVNYTCGTTTGGTAVGGSVNSPASVAVSIAKETVNMGSTVSGCNISEQLSNWSCHTNSSSENVPVTSSNNSYSFVQPYDNVTCEAIWPSTPTHTVTYTCGSNASGEPPLSQPNIIYGSNVNLPSVPGTCYNDDSWRFYRWYCTGNYTGSLYDTPQNSFNMLNENVTCEAIWDNKAGLVYTLVYDCGDGSGSAPAMQQVEDSASSLSVVLESNTCSAPSNKLFTGWDCYVNSQGLGSISQYDVGDDYYLSSGNSTCVAHYECETGYDYDVSTGNCYMREYSITYNCNNSQVQQTYVDNNNGNGYFYGDTASLWQQSGNTVGSCQIPEHKLFAGWQCGDVNGYSPSGDGLSSNDNLYHTYVTFETLDDVLADNVICEAVWVCDTANGYTLHNGVCTNEYSILYRPGSHGVFDSGYGPYFISFGPGANLGGGTWGQPWSTQTQGNTHIVANDNCYEFCGWSESQSDVCGSGSILSAGTQQGNYNHTNLFGNPSSLDLYAIWGCASSCVQSGNQCVPAPTTYTVTYHGGSCNASAQDFSNPVNAGSNHTVENPECASSNSNGWLPTDGCREFIGWSTQDPSQLQNQNPTINYGNCDDSCSNQTGSCGTITNVSSNIDLYAICDVMAHNVIYHDCDDYEVYTHSNAISLPDGAQSANYTPLSPSGSPLSSSSLVIDPLSSFQGWATTQTNDGEEWCALSSDKLYTKLFGGNSGNADYKYTKTGKMCKDVHLYAVCCPLNLFWGLNGGSWPTGSSGNQTTCEYGASAGAPGSIGYGQTPLQTPLRTGYTFSGWKVTNYSTP